MRSRYLQPYSTLAFLGATVVMTSAAPAFANPPPSPSLLISEFRVRGPNGANDEFVEIYNASDASHVVEAPDGSAGYALAASDGVIRFTIPNGTLIPARGYFLGVNSVGYSLASYPSGAGTTATGDATYTKDIPDNAGIALFNTANTSNFILANRLDAVGSTSEANTLYKEGNGYPALTPFSIDYSFYRGAGGTKGVIPPEGCTLPLAAPPIDSNDNAQDFIFVDTNGTSAGAGQRLGAPGPQNLSSPVASLPASSTAISLLDPAQSEAADINKLRDFTSDPANNSTFGTVSLRRTYTNDTGAPLTRLRFRVVVFSTFPAKSGVADLRPRTSTDVVVSVGGVMKTVRGTKLEQPPSQPNGGGFNTSLSVPAVSLATPLAAGASIDLQFLMGIQQTGDFWIGMIPEALPAAPANVWTILSNTDHETTTECAVKATTTKLTSSAQVAVEGESVTLSADVGTATGQVTFLDGTAELQTVALVNGKAEYTVNQLTPGSHSFIAKYTPDAGFAASTSTATSVNVKAKTTTALTSSVASIVEGNDVTLTANVGSAVGDVVFYDGSEELQTVTVVDGKAQYIASGLSVGFHTFTAQYQGGPNYVGSTSTDVEVEIKPAPVGTATVLTTSSMLIGFGDSVTLAAQTGGATGSITFLEGAQELKTVALSDSKAEFVVTGLPVGLHTFTAHYTPDGNFIESTSDPVTIEVKVKTAAVLQPSATKIVAGDVLTLAADIGEVPGTISFYEGETWLATLPLAGGKAEYAIQGLAIGDHSFTARYAGEGQYLPSMSTPVTVTVGAKPVTDPDSKPTTPTQDGGPEVITKPDAGSEVVTSPAETPDTVETPAALDSGGGCSTSGHSSSGVGGLAGLLLAATVLARRRR